MFYVSQQESQMKKSLLFLPLLGLASNVAAQELRGVVTDADNNPLVGASVYWAETTIGASTSATGAYTVHRVKNYDRLVASYLGYVNDTIRIADGVAEQNFRLRSEGVDIEGVVVESTLGGNYVKRDGILKGETISFAGLCKMACCNLAESFENSASVTVGYSDAISGARQIKMRASRIGVPQDKLYVLAENDVESILEKCEGMQPDVLVIDSIQTMVSEDSASAPGSVSQVRQSAGAIVRYAKETGTSTFIVGHVTKEGSLAGPRILEHMVDAVLYFEGDRQHEYRLLRAVKNRFGSVNELGVFEMRSEGMIPVPNPSETLLSQRARGAGGSVVFCTLQGSRPILCDLQALAAKSFYSVPKRTVGGMDSSRVALLLAVMEKRAGKKLFDQDVYINVAGGLALSDPAADLAVCVAVASSLMGFALSPSLSVMGEVDLCGEVRPVSQAERRVAECVRLGFTEILLPKQNMKSIKPIEGVRLTGVDTLMQALAVVTD